MEEFDFDHARALKRDTIAHLGTLDFVTARDNVVFLGPPGTGKTHLAIGLAIRACKAGHRVLFATASEWVARLAEAHHAGRLQTLKNARIVACADVVEAAAQRFAADFGAERPRKYPWSPVVTGEHPDLFRAAVARAAAFTRDHRHPDPLLLVASLNEWTEGHYLEPDQRFGRGWLEALRDGLA